jgi:threonine dehydrogenase-like Zn-dependent dehydrogenase
MKALQFSVSVPQFITLKALGVLSRKAYYKGPLAAVKLVDIPEPELPSEEWVRIETLMCGFCASDLNLIFLKESPSASPFTSFPCVIGHEICGRVAAVGSEVSRVQPSEVVTVSPALNCATRQIDPVCPACDQGMVANCENYANGTLAPGMIIGLCTDTGGGFAPYFVAHQSQIFKLPPELPPEQGALIEPLSVGLQSVYSNKPQEGDKVLIIGGGVIGTMVLKAIRALDFNCSVAVADPSEYAAELARKAGADNVIIDKNIPGAAVKLTGAVNHKPMMGANLLMGGFDRIYDTVGSPGTLNTAMRCLKAGGTLSQVGIWHDVKLDLTPLWLKQQTLKGVYGCGYATYKDAWMHIFDIAIDLVQEGKVALDGMITHKFELDNFEEMIEVNLAKEKHRAIKTAVSFVTN